MGVGNDYIEKAVVGDKEVKVVYDENPENPRQWDNLGTFIVFSNRYSSPDDNPFASHQDFLKAVSERDHIIFPVYCYAHGAVWYNLESFYGRVPEGHARFDSWHAGYIYVHKQVVREWFNVKRVTRDVVERVYSVFKGEVEEWSAYINGWVYEFLVETEDGEVVDVGNGYYSVEEALNDGIAEADGFANVAQLAWKVFKTAPEELDRRVGRSTNGQVSCVDIGEGVVLTHISSDEQKALMYPFSRHEFIVAVKTVGREEEYASN